MNRFGGRTGAERSGPVLLLALAAVPLSALAHEETARPPGCWPDCCIRLGIDHVLAMIAVGLWVRCSAPGDLVLPVAFRW